MKYIRGRLGLGRLQEPTKIVISRSRTIAIFRNTIHLLPVGGAIAAIHLNSRGLYIGASLKNLNALQFAAKVHELTMIASLTHILITMIREEMILGDGLPFGALLSGLQTSQLSYLWSMEFWGSIKAPSMTGWRKLRLIVMIVSCVSLAATVGPSSAIALIPRVGSWPAGRTRIWLNSTREDLFPTQVSSQVIPTSCMNSSSLPTQDSCPSSGWWMLGQIGQESVPNIGPPSSNWANLLDWYNPYSKPQHEDAVLYGDSFQIQGRHSSVRTLDIWVGTDSAHCRLDVWATVQTNSVADSLKSMTSFWRVAIERLSGRLSSHLSSIMVLHTVQPIAAVNLIGSSAIFGADDDEPLLTSSETHNGCSPFASDVNVTGITRTQLLALGSSLHPRLVFVDLVILERGWRGLGAVLLDPRPPGNDTQLYTVCLIAAGWASLELNTTGDDIIHRHDPHRRFVQDASKKYFFPNFPLQWISLTTEWASLTNPQVTDLNMSVYSALSGLVNGGHSSDYMIENLDEAETLAEGGAQEFQLELVAALLVNGLSNIGTDASLQGDITLYNDADVYDIDGRDWILHNKDFFTVDPQQSADWLQLEVTSAVTGLRYNMNGVAIKIAVAILIIYCVVAISHIIHTSIRARTSASWNTMAELTALAMNSSPTATLRNTCAGIMCLNTFKTNVRVVATHYDDEDDDGHLELVFDQHEEKAKGEKVRFDATYGILEQHVQQGLLDSTRPQQQRRRRCSI